MSPIDVRATPRSAKHFPAASRMRSVAATLTSPTSQCVDSAMGRERQRLVPAHEVARGEASRGLVDDIGREAGEQFLEDDAAHQPRGGSAEAVMCPGPEGEDLS